MEALAGGDLSSGSESGSDWAEEDGGEEEGSSEEEDSSEEEGDGDVSGLIDDGEDEGEGGGGGYWDDDSGASDDEREVASSLTNLKAKGMLWDCRNCTLQNYPSAASAGTACAGCGCGWVPPEVTAADLRAGRKWTAQPSLADALTGAEPEPSRRPPRLAWAYDARMLAHKELAPAGHAGPHGIHPERPDRVRAIHFVYYGKTLPSNHFQ